MSINPIYKIRFNKITETYYLYRSGRPVQLRKNTTPAMRKFFTISTITKHTNAVCVWEYRG